MTMVAAQPRITPEELLAMPEAVNYELVDGQLLERKMGWESSYIAATISFLLNAFVRTRRLGLIAGADASYRCFPDDPQRVRKPDVSYLRIDRLPEGRPPQGHCLIAPDLVMEVISPNDLYYEVELKVEEYLSAGVQMVWVLNPPTKTIRVHRSDGSGSFLVETDELDGGTVIPGFRVPVADVFARPGTPGPA